MISQQIENEEEEYYLPHLWELAIPAVTQIILDVWDFSFNQLHNIDLEKLKRVFKTHFDFPPHIALEIANRMFFRRGQFSFGHVLWILESKCHRIYKQWLSGFNMKVLCDFISPEAKDSISELIVCSIDDVSDIEHAKCFPNLSKLEIILNNHVTNSQIQQITSNCQLLQRLSLIGCNSITHHFYHSLCKTRSIQENLNIIDVSGTSGSTASTIYFLLPQLTLLVYDDVSSFLRYRFFPCTNNHMPCKQTIHTIRLGSNGIGGIGVVGGLGGVGYCGENRFRFVTNSKIKKEMELSLPNNSMSAVDDEGYENIFVFHPDQNDTFRFQDVFIAITSVPSHVVFGVPSHEAYLKEICLTSVRDIDITLLLRQFPRLQKISLFRYCSVRLISGVLPPLSNSITNVELWFVPNTLINSFLKCCPNLEYLCIGRMKLTRDAFQDLEFNHLKFVKVIHCEGYANVIDLFPIQTKVKNIKSVN